MCEMAVNGPFTSILRISGGSAGKTKIRGKKEKRERDEANER